MKILKDKEVGKRKFNTQALTFSRMYDMWQKGAIGYKEFRNWLANEYPEFSSIRDTSVDDRIDEMARARYGQNNVDIPEEQQTPDSGAAS